MDGITLTAKPEVINGQIRMMGDRILVRPLQWSGEEVHGKDTRIIVERSGRPLRGTVIAVGPGRHPTVRKGKTRDGKHVKVTESKRFQPTEVKVGDVVELGGLNQFDGQGYQFTEVIYNGVRHLICTERDVCGVRE